MQTSKGKHFSVLYMLQMIAQKDSRPAYVITFILLQSIICHIQYNNTIIYVIHVIYYYISFIILQDVC